MSSHSYHPCPDDLNRYISQRQYLSYAHHDCLDLTGPCWFNSHSEGPFSLAEVMQLVNQDTRRADEFHIQGLVHFTYAALRQSIHHP